MPDDDSVKKLKDVTLTFREMRGVTSRPSMAFSLNIIEMSKKLNDGMDARSSYTSMSENILKDAVNLIYFGQAADLLKDADNELSNFIKNGNHLQKHMYLIQGHILNIQNMLNSAAAACQTILSRNSNVGQCNTREKLFIDTCSKAARDALGGVKDMLSMLDHPSIMHFIGEEPGLR